MMTIGPICTHPAQGSCDCGSVLNVGMSQASVLFVQPKEVAINQVTVGNFLGIRRGHLVLVGAITTIATGTTAVTDTERSLVAQVDLFGELLPDREGRLRFRRGLSVYPSAGDAAQILNGPELNIVFSVPDEFAVQLGRLHQDPSIAAKVNVEQLVSKHFAVLGTTGVGKSSGVALLLQRIMASQSQLRVFLLDPHNEYGRCFGDRAQVLNPKNLRLPFWLFNFEEIVDVLFRGRPGVEEEVAILSEVIPQAKAMYDSQRGDAKLVRRPDARGSGYTADTPCPYRLNDLVALLDERLGKLENRPSASTYNKLISRIESVRNDRRYAFMFDSTNAAGDNMVDVVTDLFQLPPLQSQMTVMQLAGFPSEVVDAVVSVVSRMAFDFGLWSDGAFPLLFVCEEAHRYAPADRTLGFGPTRKALSRIAKEGRKYGVFLGLVTQRAGELDSTILSQCSTIFAMRMANEQDQRIVRSAVSEAASSLLGFVSALSTREVLAFGEGVALPLRFLFDELPRELLPRGEALQLSGRPQENLEGRDLIASVVERWRGATLSQRKAAEPSLASATPDADLSTANARFLSGGAAQSRPQPTLTPVAPRRDATADQPKATPAGSQTLIAAFRERRF